MTIDAATSPVCGWCQRTLPPNGPSADFCGELHQSYWHTHHRDVGPLWSPIGVGAAVVPCRIEQFDTTVYNDHFAEQHAYFAAITTAFTEALNASLRAAAQAIQTLIEGLHVTGVIEDENSPDPKARALQLRRNRNTGPAIHRRAPKRIDATRTRQ